MFGDREAEAETVDELKEQQGEVRGIANPDPDDADTRTFFGNRDAYPAGSGTLPPTEELDEPTATDALHPEEERRGDDEPGDTPGSRRIPAARRADPSSASSSPRARIRIRAAP